VIVKNGIGLLMYKQGQIIKKTLSAANETVNAGIYDATTLSTVDADLASGNIKSGVTIFGKAGAATIKDVSDWTDAVEADVVSGKKFYKADGSQGTGTHI
jgi:hypothetical protein